jgi:hypothetical protein
MLKDVPACRIQAFAHFEKAFEGLRTAYSQSCHAQCHVLVLTACALLRFLSVLGSCNPTSPRFSSLLYLIP